MRDKELFSSEYMQEDQTNTDSRNSYHHETEESQEIFIPEEHYEISKPKRIILRGKIINGKD